MRLTLREARTYASLAVAAALVLSAGVGAVTDAALGVAVALTTVGGALAAVRLRVTR